MFRTPSRRTAGLVSAIAVPVTLASSLLLAAPASADVIATRDVSAGPVNRGVIAITSVTCERTDEPGDFGRLTISGDVLVPPAKDDTVSIRVNDRVTHENYEVLPLAEGATTFTTTIAADGLSLLPTMELVVAQLNPLTGMVGQRDRVVTLGRCGWADYASLPVPTATSVEFTDLVPSAQITNTAEFGLTVNVSFTTCRRTAPGSSACTIEKTAARVVVPAGGTATATSPQAVAPDSVLIVETGIVGPDVARSRYAGQALMVDTPSA